jgi:uncharacterized protein YndB with AHSA1/START domain
MRELSDSIEVDAPPDEVWRWITALADHYTEWHPDHVSAAWVRGVPNEPGSILEAVERLGRHEERLQLQVTAVEPPTRLRYRFRGPIQMLLPEGSFTIEPSCAGTRFTARIAYRGGPLTERAFRSRARALRCHMHEEGRNLKRIIESKSTRCSPTQAELG